MSRRFFLLLLRGALALSELRLFPISLTQIPKFGIVLFLVVVLVIGALDGVAAKRDILHQIC
jgi:hypothetical protein